MRPDEDGGRQLYAGGGLMTFQHLGVGVDPFSDECLPAELDPFHEYDPRDDLEEWQR